MCSLFQGTLRVRLQSVLLHELSQAGRPQRAQAGAGQAALVPVAAERACIQAGALPINVLALGEAGGRCHVSSRGSSRSDSATPRADGLRLNTDLEEPFPGVCGPDAGQCPREDTHLLDVGADAASTTCCPLRADPDEARLRSEPQLGARWGDPASTLKREGHVARRALENFVEFG